MVRGSANLTFTMPWQSRPPTKPSCPATYADRIHLRFGSFRQVNTEALFIDMEPVGSRYESLLGYVPLEQSQAVLDLAGHRLAKIDRVDLKSLISKFPDWF